MSDINKDNKEDSTQPQEVYDWFLTPAGQDALINNPNASKIQAKMTELIKPAAGTGDSEKDPVVTVPSWLYDAATGSVTPGTRRRLPDTGGPARYQTIPGRPQSIQQNQLDGLVLRLLGQGNKAALNQLSKYLTGKTGIAPEKLMDIWSSTLNLVNITGLSLDKVIQSKDLKQFRLGALTGGGTNINRTVVLTTEDNARRDLVLAMTQALGRKPSDQEVKDYQRKLNAAERKNPTVTRAVGGTTTVTESGLDRQRFLRNYVLSKAEWAQDLEGDIGTVQDRVDQELANFGVSKVATRNMRIDLMRQYAKGEMSEEALRAAIRDLAANTYSAFSDKLKENPKMTLRDVAAPLISTYATLMEEDPETVDLSNVLSRAVGPDGKPLSAFDFQKVVRKDPKYQFTGNAHQEAAAFGRAFAQSMGVNL